MLTTETRVIIDHHRRAVTTNDNAVIFHLDPGASSACEMVTELLQYMNSDIEISKTVAEALLSGIMLDTKNFVIRAGVRTFEAAAFLRRNGADVTRVRKLFRENVDEYKAKADAVSQAEIYRTYYAISTCSGDGVDSPTVIGAQAANELLNIKGIRASFIFTAYQGIIYVSARSIDEVNVQVIMERLGGGGHLNVAGCQFENSTIEESIEALKRTIDTMIEEGDLE